MKNSHNLGTSSKGEFSPNPDYVRRSPIWSSLAKTDGFVGGKVLESIDSSKEISSLAELFSSAKGVEMAKQLKVACERLAESWDKGHIKCPSELNHTLPKGSGMKRFPETNLLQQIDDEISRVQRTEFESEKDSLPEFIQVAMSNSDIKSIEDGDWDQVNPKVLKALFDDGETTKSWNESSFQYLGVSEWSELHSNPNHNDILSSRKGVIQPKRLPNVFGRQRI